MIGFIFGVVVGLLLGLLTMKSIGIKAGKETARQMISEALRTVYMPLGQRWHWPLN